MPDWFGSRQKSSDPAGHGRDRRHAGFYAIEDPWGSALDAFDEKFDLDDPARESARKSGNRFRWRWRWRKRRETSGDAISGLQTRRWQADHWRGRSRTGAPREGKRV